jgi:hypothetical protein
MAELLVKEFSSAAIVAVGRTVLSDGFFQRVLRVEAASAPDDIASDKTHVATPV